VTGCAPLPRRLLLAVSLYFDHILPIPHYPHTLITLHCLAPPWICLHLHHSSHAGRATRPGLSQPFITLFLPPLQSTSSNLRAPKLWTTALLSLTQRDHSTYRRSTLLQAVAHLFETHHQQTAKDASSVATMVQWTSEKDAVVSSHSTIQDIPPTDHLLSSWSASLSMLMLRPALNSGTTPQA
jgi:hypothetical protein